MILRKRLKDATFLIRIGAACLLLANLSHWFLHPTTDFWRGMVDGMTGFLFGVSFGCLLLGARLKSSRGDSTQDRTCA
jgi:uncharacterized membrane protein YedE/YeeE